MKNLIIILINTVSILLNACYENETQYEKWDNGIIPYYFDASISENARIKVKEAIADIEKNTNVRFIEVNTLKPYTVKVIKIDSMVCIANIGKKKNSKLQLAAFSKSVLLHELGHIVGLPHEHERPDRNNYITVLWENIDDNNFDQFETFDQDEVLYNYKNYAYDYKSIMHYKKYAYSKNRKETIKADCSLDNFSLSEIDIQKINEIYP